ncbi:MAG: hotdog family protein [Minisyncoccota bacterium]
MQRVLIVLCLSFLLPTGALAASAPASFVAAHSLLVASSSPGNVYATGVSVVLTAPVAGDFSAFGGSIITAAPIAGDGLLIAGSISSRAPISGDFRAAGGSVNVEKPVTGDLVAFGFSVYDTGRAGGSVFIAAANAALLNGASGPVTVYGNTVSLAGDFGNNVTVVTSGHLTLAPGTTIHGKLSYEAPDIATIPASATILGGIAYTNASYIPDSGTSRALAFVSIGVFLIVRILGALILAGLLAGLFPKLAEAVTEHAYRERPRDILLTMLLGFAAFVVTPVLFLMLALTFVGIGLALLLLFAYALMALLALMYAGILFGSVLVRRFSGRVTVLWRDGVLGMLALSLLALVPFIGPLIVLFFALFSAGALLLLFFHFAFPREEHTPEML